MKLCACVSVVCVCLCCCHRVIHSLSAISSKCFGSESPITIRRRAIVFIIFIIIIQSLMFIDGNQFYCSKSELMTTIRGLVRGKDVRRRLCVCCLGIGQDHHLKFVDNVIVIINRFVKWQNSGWRFHLDVSILFFDAVINTSSIFGHCVCAMEQLHKAFGLLGDIAHSSNAQNLLECKCSSEFVFFQR